MKEMFIFSFLFLYRSVSFFRLYIEKDQNTFDSGLIWLLLALVVQSSTLGPTNSMGFIKS